MQNPIKLILAILLLLCLAKMPYGYFQLVRFLAMAGFGYLAYESYKEKKENRIILYITLAILFQPIFKIALGRTIWNIVDAVVAIGLLLSLVSGKRKS